MGLGLIVKIHAITKGTTGVADRFIEFQIHCFIFHAAPHALDEHVVVPSTFIADHGQSNFPTEQGVCERVPIHKS